MPKSRLEIVESKIALQRAIIRHLQFDIDVHRTQVNAERERLTNAEQSLKFVQDVKSLRNIELEEMLAEQSRLMRISKNRRTKK
jgi:uncharacterized coiled-coil protein SlyX